jgi:hypothetical protein
MTQEHTGTASYKMQCLPDQPKKRRRRAPKELAPEIAEQLKGLLPEEALQEGLSDLLCVGSGWLIEC